jgi:phenylacetate-coenzyme A ligase PaaK-like adenylate-forming protein
MPNISKIQSSNVIVLQDQLKEFVFPLNQHPLYGTISKFDESPYLMPSVLADFTNEADFSQEATSLEICPACFFNTSGTTNRSKKIPFSDSDLERQKAHESVALKKLGMGKGDGVLSLGAPLPSISGWAIVNGSEACGAKALNTSQLDFEDIFTYGFENQVTFVIGTPIVVKEIGRAIEEEHGPLDKVFHNMKTGIIFGDVLPDALRNELKSIWGFEHVYSLYGTVEADVVATECVESQGEMDLMSERLLFEFLPEDELEMERKKPGYIPKAIAIENIDNGSYGEILISDLARETLPLIRYRIGDVIKVHRSTGSYNMEYPTITVLGRSKNTVRMDDIPVYEMQLDTAIKRSYQDQIKEWRLVENDSAALPRYTIFLQLKNDDVSNDLSSDTIYTALCEQRPELAHIDSKRIFDISVIQEFEKIAIDGDVKSQRIVLKAN